MDIEDKLHFQSYIGDSEYKVSTVSISPIWGYTYETMVFGDSWTELDCKRYKTLKEALIGHSELFVKWAEIVQFEQAY